MRSVTINAVPHGSGYRYSVTCCQRKTTIHTAKSKTEAANRIMGVASNYDKFKLMVPAEVKAVIPEFFE